MHRSAVGHFHPIAQNWETLPRWRELASGVPYNNKKLRHIQLPASVFFTPTTSPIGSPSLLRTAVTPDSESRVNPLIWPATRGKSGLWIFSRAALSVSTLQKHWCRHLPPLKTTQRSQLSTSQFNCALCQRLFPPSGTRRHSQKQTEICSQTPAKGAAMSGGDVVCSGWLRKSPPEKKLRRYVSAHCTSPCYIVEK